MKHVLGLDTMEIAPTVGFNIKTLEYNGYLLNLWDVGGQKSIRAYWRNYFEETDGVIWVVDSVDRYRLEECRNQLRDILRQVPFPAHKLLKTLTPYPAPTNRRSCPAHRCSSLRTSRTWAGRCRWRTSRPTWTWTTRTSPAATTHCCPAQP